MSNITWSGREGDAETESGNGELRCTFLFFFCTLAGVARVAIVVIIPKERIGSHKGSGLQHQRR